MARARRQQKQRKPNTKAKRLKQPKEKTSLLRRLQARTTKSGTKGRNPSRYRSVHELNLHIDASLTQFALEGKTDPIGFEELYAQKIKEADLQENEELHYIGNGVFAVFFVKRNETKIEKFKEIRRLETVEKAPKLSAWQKELLIPVFPEHTFHAEPLYTLYRNQKIDSYLN